MWRELVAGIFPEAEFTDGVARADLDRAEAQLDHPVAELLAALLLETNGVLGEYGLRLVWGLERIVESNLRFRTDADYDELYMPFTPMTFFADAGNGGQFALLNPPIDRDDVFTWNHEDDSRTWAAPDIETYLRWWASGELTI